MATTKVQKTTSEYQRDDGSTEESDQFRTTIPKDIAEAFELSQGDELEWTLGSARNKLEVVVVDD